MTLEVAVTDAAGAVVRHRVAVGGSWSIGRDPDCDLVLVDLDVSRRHLTLQALDDGWLVVDRSSNGTLVGEALVRQSSGRLGPGVPLRIGPFSLDIRVAAGSAPGAGSAGAGSAGAAPAPAVSQQSALRKKVHRRVLESLDLARLDRDKMDDAEMRPRVIAALRLILDQLADEIPRGLDREQLVRELTDETLGLGPLEPLLADPTVSEIMVVDPQTIFCERGGKLERSALAFTDDDAARAVIERIITPLGRRIDESSPYVDARLRDGSRVNAIIRPLALRGACITIRKFGDRAIGLADLIRFDSMTEPMARFLSRAVRARKNVVISGGTGSGKTTLLNALSAVIAERERIVTIEDAAELRLAQSHVVSLETRPANMEGRGEVSIRDLVRNALRMRPDRIIVGECRGGEALDMLQAMNTGHEGSMTTTHANSPREAVARLETLALMAGLDLPVRAIREQLAASVDLIVQQSRLFDGSRRVTSIAEVIGLDDDGRVELQEIFSFERHATGPDGEAIGSYRATGTLPTFLDQLIALGLIDDGEYL